MPESEKNIEETGRLANQVKAFARTYLRAGGFNFDLPFTKAVLDMADEAVWAGTNIGDSSLRTAKIALRAQRRGLDAGPFRKASDLGYDIFAAYQNRTSEDLLQEARISKRSLTEDAYQAQVKRIEQAEAARIHAETYLYLPDRSGRRLDQQAVVAYAESLLNSPPANISDENYWQAYRSAIISLLNGESLLKSDLRNQGLNVRELTLKVNNLRVGFVWNHVKLVTDLRRQARLQHLRDTGTF